MRPLYYAEDEPGVLTPIDHAEFARRFEVENRRVAWTELPGGAVVSTVWLGIDHQYGAGPPLVYETMVFASRHDWGGEYQRRYTYRAEAIAGHAEVVARERAQAARVRAERRRDQVRRPLTQVRRGRARERVAAARRAVWRLVRVTYGTPVEATEAALRGAR